MLVESLQRHPFLRLLMPLVGGIVCGDAFPYVLPVGVWVAGLLLLIGLYLLSRRRTLYGQLYGGFVFIYLFALGGSSVSLQLKQSEGGFSTTSTTASVYQVTLTEHPEKKERSLLCHAVLQGEVRKDTLIYKTGSKKLLLYFPIDSAASSLKRGDELWIYTRLSPPVNNGNPGEFDYARYLLRKGVSGRGYVPADGWRVIGHHSSLTLGQTASDYREKMVGFYRELGIEGDELAVLSALTIGDKDELSDEIRETYSVAGASHVLALSGLHIGFIYALFLFVLSPLWRRWRVLKPFLLMLIILCLWSFAFFTGLSSSVVRAVVMYSLLILSTLQLQKPLTLNTLSFTAFVMLLVNPVWLFDVGFQLSFSAVAAIVLFQPGLYGLLSLKNSILRKVWALVTVSIAAQMGTAPLVILYFSRFPTHFLWTNLWVIPCVSLIMYAAFVLLLLTPFPILQHPFADVLETLVRLQNKALHWVEQLPWASIDSIRTDAWEVLLLYLCLLLFGRAWMQCTAANISVAMFALLCGVVYHSYSIVAEAPRRSLVFYNVRSCPSVHCLTNTSRSWLVSTDSLPDISYLQRALSPYWNRLHLEQPIQLTGNYSAEAISVHNQLVCYAGKRVCMLSDNRWKNKRADCPLAIDYLYISKGYKGGVKELTSLFAIDTVVLDSSLSTYYQEKIISDCIGLGISYLSLSKKGSVCIAL